MFIFFKLSPVRYTQAKMLQKNISIPINFNAVGDFNFNAYVPFGVKQINARVSYSWWLDDQPIYHTYLVTSDLVEGDVIGHMSNFKFNKVVVTVPGNPAAVPPVPDVTASRDYYSSHATIYNCYRFMYKDPVQVHGSYQINIKELANQGPPTGGTVLVHLEFLSEQDTH